MMADAQTYCTTSEIETDLDLPGAGDYDRLVQLIRAASGSLARRAGGNFIPVTEAVTMAGEDSDKLYLDPLISLASITRNGAAITTADVVLHPRSKHWRHGPYSRLVWDDNVFDDEDTIILTGQWGLYSDNRALGVTVATDNGSEIVVSVGTSDVAPGAVLLIETEQILVDGLAAAQASGETLAVAAVATDEVLTLSTGTLVAPGEMILIDGEQMLVADLIGTACYVRRGWNGTERAGHSLGVVVSVFRTLTTQRGVNGTIAATHAGGTAISRMIVPDEINWITRKIAALMFRNAQAGFAGRVGSADLGDVSYINEFPQTQVKDVLKNYQIVRLW